VNLESGGYIAQVCDWKRT